MSSGGLDDEQVKPREAYAGEKVVNDTVNWILTRIDPSIGDVIKMKVTFQQVEEELVRRIATWSNYFCRILGTQLMVKFAERLHQPKYDKEVIRDLLIGTNQEIPRLFPVLIPEHLSLFPSNNPSLWKNSNSRPLVTRWNDRQTILRPQNDEHRKSLRQLFPYFEYEAIWWYSLSRIHETSFRRDFENGVLYDVKYRQYEDLNFGSTSDKKDFLYGCLLELIAILRQTYMECDEFMFFRNIRYWTECARHLYHQTWPSNLVTDPKWVSGITAFASVVRDYLMRTNSAFLQNKNLSDGSDRVQALCRLAMLHEIGIVAKLVHRVKDHFVTKLETEGENLLPVIRNTFRQSLTDKMEEAAWANDDVGQALLTEGFQHDVVEIFAFFSMFYSSDELLDLQVYGKAVRFYTHATAVWQKLSPDTWKQFHSYRNIKLLLMDRYNALFDDDFYENVEEVEERYEVPMAYYLKADRVLRFLLEEKHVWDNGITRWNLAFLWGCDAIWSKKVPIPIPQWAYLILADLAFRTILTDDQENMTQGLKKSINFFNIWGLSGLTSPLFETVKTLVPKYSKKVKQKEVEKLQQQLKEVNLQYAATADDSTKTQLTIARCNLLDLLWLEERRFWIPLDMVESWLHIVIPFVQDFVALPLDADNAELFRLIMQMWTIVVRTFLDWDKNNPNCRFGEELQHMLNAPRNHFVTLLSNSPPVGELHIFTAEEIRKRKDFLSLTEQGKEMVQIEYANLARGDRSHTSCYLFHEILYVYRQGQPVPQQWEWERFLPREYSVTTKGERQKVVYLQMKHRPTTVQVDTMPTSSSSSSSNNSNQEPNRKNAVSRLPFAASEII